MEDESYMSKKATSIVSYLTALGWLIAYCFGDREGAKFYLNQSLLIVLGNLVLSILGRMFHGGIVGVVLGLINLAVFILWVIGFIHACKQEEIPLPLIGDINILK